MHFTNFVFEMLVDQIYVNNNLVKGAKITKERTTVKSAESYFEKAFFLTKSFIIKGKTAEPYGMSRSFVMKRGLLYFDFIQSLL